MPSPISLNPSHPPRKPQKVRTLSQDLLKLADKQRQLFTEHEQADRISHQILRIREQEHLNALRNPPLDPVTMALNPFQAIIDKLSFLIINRFLSNSEPPQNEQAAQEDLTPEAQQTRQERIHMLESKVNKINERLEPAMRLNKRLEKALDAFEKSKDLDSNSFDDSILEDYLLAEESEYQEIQQKRKTLKPYIEEASPLFKNQSRQQ